MVLGFTVLFCVLLVRVSGGEGSGPAQKLVRELGFVINDLMDRILLGWESRERVGWYRIVSLVLFGVVVE